MTVKSRTATHFRQINKLYPATILSQRAKWDALANVLLSSYLKVLIQIASFFSVKYSSSKVIAKSISRNPKRSQKQSKQHRSSLLLDDVTTLRAPKRNGYIEIWATVEIAARYDLSTIRALPAERKKNLKSLGGHYGLRFAKINETILISLTFWKYTENFIIAS